MALAPCCCVQRFDRLGLGPELSRYIWRLARSRREREDFMKATVFKSGDASLGRCVGKAAGPMRAIWFWTYANRHGLPNQCGARATWGWPLTNIGRWASISFYRGAAE